MSKQIRIGVCSFDVGRNSKPQTEPGMARFQEAAMVARLVKDEGADIAVFPENFLMVELDCQNQLRMAERMDGPIFDEISKVARSLNIFIAANHPTLNDGKIFNSTILFDRKGKIVGAYHKSFPTITELKYGCSPGTGPIVVDTEIGKIGFVICYDLNFTELRMAYKRLGPEIILFSSYFRGGLQTQMWAYETGAYLVCATIDPSSRIINPLGRVIKNIDLITKSLTASINLDYGIFHYDYNHKLIRNLRSKFGNLIEIEPAEAEGVFLLTATGSVPLSSIIDASGLEPVDKYFKRASDAVSDAKTGKWPDKSIDSDSW